MATLLFAEKEQTLFFHPPLEPLDNKESALVRRDPEIPEESQPKNGDYSMECTDKYPDAEQQALFATMLGMDSLDESTSVVPLPRENLEPTSTARMIASIQDEILQDKCDDYEKHYRRCQLFQEISEYFPQHMVQPAKNLTDFAPVWIHFFPVKSITKHGRTKIVISKCQNTDSQNCKWYCLFLYVYLFYSSFYKRFLDLNNIWPMSLEKLSLILNLYRRGFGRTLHYLIF